MSYEGIGVDEVKPNHEKLELRLVNNICMLTPLIA